MIRRDGYSRFSIWEHSSQVTDLYTRRAEGTAEEMTCAAQAAELLKPLVKPGDTLLDVGCGSGYFFHSLKKRGVPVEYHGIDAAPNLIEIGRRCLPAAGLAPERLQHLRIEDLGGEADHVVCMNVLSNIDNYHRPLERLLKVAKKSLVLRESLKDGASYSYVVDKYLDAPEPLKVHVNAYDRREVTDFIRSHGFKVREVTDQRTQGKPELVIDYPHYWVFLVAEKA